MIDRGSKLYNLGQHNKGLCLEIAKFEQKHATRIYYTSVAQLLFS